MNSLGSKEKSKGSSVCRLLFRSLNAVVLHSTETLQRAGVNGASASVFLIAFNGSSYEASFHFDLVGASGPLRTVFGFLR